MMAVLEPAHFNTAAQYAEAGAGADAALCDPAAGHRGGAVCRALALQREELQDLRLSHHSLPLHAWRRARHALPHLCRHPRMSGEGVTRSGAWTMFLCLSILCHNGGCSPASLLCFCTTQAGSAWMRHHSWAGYRSAVILPQLDVPLPAGDI